jgi:rhomboid family protein
MQYGRQSYGRGGFGASIMDEFKNAFKLPDNGLMQIIFINVAVFVLFSVFNVVMFFLGASELYNTIESYFLIPASIPAYLSRPWTLITYFFMHGGFMHIIFNMLFLYWFGMIIKEFLGGAKVVSLYVLGGIAGGLLYLLMYNLIPQLVQNVDNSVMLGASGAVYAIVVGAATLSPNYTMHLLFFGPVKIKYIALVYVFMSFVNTAGANAGGNLAHLGGAALGFLFIKQLQNGLDLGKPVHWFLTFVKSFFVHQPKVHVSYKRSTSEKTTGSKRKATKSASTSKSSDISQEEIDAILDKISQHGYESLSKDEKQKLFSAGNK